MQSNCYQGLRGNLFHFLEDPRPLADPDKSQAYQYIEDGALICDVQGKICFVGTDVDASSWCARTEAQVNWQHHPDCLILPGFIDSHLHLPQIDIIGAYGKGLLDWLNQYTFPAELRFEQAEYASSVTEVFFQQLLAQGTTTAAIYPTVHSHSTDLLFQEAKRRGMRVLAGKVLMDRNAPLGLLDDAVSAYEDSKALIEKWHGQDRLHYAVTPRFAPTSTQAQLEAAGELLKLADDIYLQTHLCETQDEIAWVASLFPKHRDYLEVYQDFGLVGPRSIFGHCIHLNDREYAAMKENQSIMSLCPTSNNFLGSGLFPMQRLKDLDLQVSFASDIGAGTSFSMLATMAEAYKVARLTQSVLHPVDAYYHLTLGAAKSLSLDQWIGNFTEGKELDAVVLNPNQTALLTHRSARCNHIEELLFVLQTMGGQYGIEQTYILGQPQI